MDKRQDSLEIYLLLGNGIGLVGNLNTEVTTLQATFPQVDLEEETSAVFDLIMHNPRGVHFQLCLLSLRAVDDHEEIKEADGAFIGHADLACDWETIVASYCKLASDVELEALEQN